MQVAHWFKMWSTDKKIRKPTESTYCLKLWDHVTHVKATSGCSSADMCKLLADGYAHARMGLCADDRVLFLQPTRNYLKAWSSRGQTHAFVTIRDHVRNLTDSYRTSLSHRGRFFLSSAEIRPRNGARTHIPIPAQNPATPAAWRYLSMSM